MKNDPTFKVLAFAILAGVIVAFAAPAHPTDSAAVEHAEAAAAVTSTTSVTE